MSQAHKIDGNMPRCCVMGWLPQPVNADMGLGLYVKGSLAAGDGDRKHKPRFYEAHTAWNRGVESNSPRPFGASTGPENRPMNCRRQSPPRIAGVNVVSPQVPRHNPGKYSLKWR